ncbi:MULTISPECIES: hypothetical protein [unclassified Streptomyces]|uniref:hypothetical protein n=1 Tax=unclassified Streptomyces TaxID=2593676 RepID=UPI0034109AB7
MTIRPRPRTWADRVGRRTVQSHVLFGGVYGTVLASSLVAALAPHGTGRSFSYLYDAAWLLITALASALAHGYAHLVAARGAYVTHGPLTALRSMVDEWPLLVATLPSLILLVGAGMRWWPSGGIEYVILTVNTVLLFSWGLAAGRAGGRNWPTSVRTGIADALLGVAVIVANTVIK